MSKELVNYKKCKNTTIRSFNSELGASLVEAVLLVALLALIAIPAVRSFGNTVGEKFCTVTTGASDGLGSVFVPGDEGLYTFVNGECVLTGGFGGGF